MSISVPGALKRPWISTQSSDSSALPATGSGMEARLCDWSNLPEELIHIISGLVTEIEDLFSFRSVCKNWRHFAALPAHLPPQLPWILLPSNPVSTVRRFFAISTGKIYTFNLPELGGHVVHCSSSGYLVLSDESLSVSLLNPFTQHQIRLPSVRSFITKRHRLLLHSEAELFSQNFHCYPFNSGGQFGVILVRHHSPQFLYWRDGDESWIEPEPTSSHPRYWDTIQTVGHHQGRFYIVHNTGTVATCDLGEAKITLIPSLRVPNYHYDRCYLNALGADLLLVTINFSHDEVERLNCFKLEQEQLKWSSIKGISDWTGDYTVLVDSKHVIIAPAADETCKNRNCVYNGCFRRSMLRTQTNLAHQLDVINIYEAMKSLPFFKDNSRCCNGLTSWFVPTL